MKRNSLPIVSDLKQLQKKILVWRKSGRKLVLTQGSFDMVHIGHARYLAAAKEYGDILVVGLDSDEKIARRKGPGRPVVPQNERSEMLVHLASVDLVVIKDVDWPRWHLIKTMKPDVLIIIKENYTADEVEKLAEFCGQVKILPRMAATSTSEKIRQVQIRAAKKLQKKLSQRFLQTLEEVIGEIK